MSIIPSAKSGEWTTFYVGDNYTSDSPYHASKTIRTIFNNKVGEEEDIYQAKIGSKIYQLNVLSAYKWKDKTTKVTGSIGILGEKNWKQLQNVVGIDSVLNGWGLSRFDNY